MKFSDFLNSINETKKLNEVLRYNTEEIKEIYRKIKV